LQHHDVLIDGLEEALSKLLDLLCIYYILPQQILSEVDEHLVSVVGQVVTEGTTEDLQIYLIR